MTSRASKWVLLPFVLLAEGAHTQHLIEIEGISPNAKDHYSYTPM